MERADAKVDKFIKWLADIRKTGGKYKVSERIDGAEEKQKNKKQIDSRGVRTPWAPLHYRHSSLNEATS